MEAEGEEEAEEAEEAEEVVEAQQRDLVPQRSPLALPGRGRDDESPVRLRPSAALQLNFRVDREQL